jgi:hypothetical protein
VSTYDYIVRRLEVVHGHMDFTMECFPAFNYARDEHQLDLSKSGRRAIFRTKNIACQLDSNVALTEQKREVSQGDTGSGVVSQFSLGEGSSITFIFKQVKLPTTKRPTSVLEAKVNLEQNCLHMCRTRTKQKSNKTN